ncbi:hypothetical protein ACFLWX_03820 [Chloroflexota bacterium]
MRVLCVFIPHFIVNCEILRHPELDGRPVLIVQTTGSRKLILDTNDVEGIQKGMPFQEALSRSKDVEIITADPPYYQYIFDHILDSLEEKSPLVEDSDLGCAYLGLDGLMEIYGNDEAIASEVRQNTPKGFSTHIGISCGKFPAYLAALSSQPNQATVVEQGIGAFLKDFPCDVLPVSWQIKRRLHDFGLCTLGQITGMPPGPFQSQFGPDGKRIWELARGDDTEPLYPRNSIEIIEENLILSSAVVTLEAILVGVESLLTKAFSRKELRGRGIRSMILWAQVWGFGYWEQRIAFKELATDVRSSLSRIKNILATTPIPGPAEEMGLKITGISRDRLRQSSFLSDIRAKDLLQENIREMEARLGDGPQVFKVKELEPWSRIPERRQILTPLN